MYKKRRTRLGFTSAGIRAGAIRVIRVIRVGSCSFVVNAIVPAEGTPDRVDEDSSPVGSE